MRTTAALLVTSILSLSITALHAATPVYPCFRAESPPAIDGDSQDTCWNTAPLATGFSILGNGFADDKQTAFRLCWDESALYLLIVCEEPDIGHLKTDVRDGGQAWLNDGVEIFLQPGGSGQTWQFVITAAAARTTGAGNADFRLVEAAVGHTQQSYTLEIAIPHELVRATPGAGDTWRGNVCRNIWTTTSGGDKFTSWAPLRRQFLEPENFGVIDFRGAPPSEEDITALTRDLNSDYRDHLLAAVRNLVAQAPEYTPVLEQARRSEELSARSRRLLYRWYRLRRMHDDSARYSIQDLRDIVQNAEDLLAQSYDVKYAWLIDRLFPD